MPVHFLDRVHRPACGTIAVGIVLEVRLEDWFQHELGGGLGLPDPGSLECRAVARPHPVSGSSHAAPDRAGTSSRSVPRASLPASYPDPTFRSPRRSFHPCPAHLHWRGPTHRRGGGCLRDKSCRRADRSGRQAPPSPCDKAFSEGSGSQSGVARLIANHLTSPSSKAHQKSGSFAPPVLPGFNGHTDPVRLPP